GQSAGALSIGAGIARNVVKNKDKAGVTNSKISAGGALSIDAEASPTVAALGIGVAGSVSNGTGNSGASALAGGVAINSIDNEVAAYIVDDGTVPTRTITAGTGVSLTAHDASDITADAGGFAISLANSSQQGFSVAGSAGAGIAVNDIGQDS